MSVEVIFWTQIASIIGFVVTLFILYRVLVATKDATIELLKEKISTIEGQLVDAKASGPDVLAERLSARVKLLNEELDRLSGDQDRNAAAIAEKERQIQDAKGELSTLEQQLGRAQELMGEFFCPHCKAPMMVREYHNESVEYGGRELDVDHEYIEYECGLTLVDGRERGHCREAVEG